MAGLRPTCAGGVCLLLLLTASSPAQTFHYVGEWRLLDAGRVEAHLGSSGARLDLETMGVTGRLYPIQDSYSVAYDRGFCAEATTESFRQGKKHREIKVSFDDGKASRIERDMIRNGETVSTNQVQTPGCVHDVLGALEKLRRTTPPRVGGRLTLPISDGRRTAGVVIHAQEKETIRTRAGVFNAVRYEAMLFNGVIFRRKARLFVWLTDDSRRLPVQIRVQLPFFLGTVTLRLEREEPG